MRAEASLTTLASPMPYIAYGLTLLSDIPLPELPPAPSVDVCETHTLRFSVRHECVATPSAEVMSWATPTGERWLSCAKFEGGYLLQFANLADFCMDHIGREIICHPRSEALSPETISHLLLDHVLPLALNARGQDALHATSVLTPDGVIAFTGASGMGKSTLAASFQHAGYPILSDDCLVLQVHPSGLLGTPAYPGLRLWGDTLSALGLTPHSARPVAHYTTKQRLMASKWIDPLPETSRRLIGIYSLIRHPTEPTPIQCERLSRRTAFMELLPHVFRLDVTDRHMLIRQLDFLEQVVTHVPVSRLKFPSSFESLDRLRKTIFTNHYQSNL